MWIGYQRSRNIVMHKNNSIGLTWATASNANSQGSSLSWQTTVKWRTKFLPDYLSAPVHRVVERGFTQLVSHAVTYRSSSEHNSQNIRFCSSTLYRVTQKLTDFCTSHNFIKYWQFSNFFHCQNQEKIVIVLSLKIPSHLNYVATLPCEMSVS